MLLFLSFLILEYIGSKFNSRKRIRQIENDFDNFKLAATKDDFILDAVRRFYKDETTMVIVLKNLLCATDITEFIDISEKYRIPIEYLLYEWNFVPAEHSSKHILNALNNDCIQEILRRLTDTADFLSVVETCHSLQANALQCYPPSFKRLSLSAGGTSNRHFMGLSLRIVSKYLQMFGHFIEELEIHDLNDDTMNMVANYCGSKLYYLGINGNGNTTADCKALSKFKALKVLNIRSISMDNVELPENLKRIFISYPKIQIDLQFVMKTFPELKSICFCGIANLSDTDLSAFITHNPNLVDLCIISCENLTVAALNNISDRLPNIEYISLDFDNNTTIEDYTEMVMHLCQLHQLKHLSIIFYFHTYSAANILIDSLVANVPTIETLHMFGLEHDFKETVTGLLQLKHLKELGFSSPAGDNYISADLIVELIKGLPVLTRIRFNCNIINVSEIMNIIECSKHLTLLEICIQEMDINLTVYNSILPLIKGHLKVIIEVYKGNIDDDYPKDNEHRLKIVKF